MLGARGSEPLVSRGLNLRSGAPVPLRLTACQAALEGKPANAETIAQAAQLATSGAKPLPMTGYKLELLVGLVRDVVEWIAK